MAGGGAVLNADSPEFAGLPRCAAGAASGASRYGQRPGSRIALVQRVPLPIGQRLAVEVLGERSEIVLPLVGGFQAMNVLAALGLVIATGAAPRAAVAALPQLDRRAGPNAAGRREGRRAGLCRLRAHAGCVGDGVDARCARMPSGVSRSCSAPAATATAASVR